MIKVIKLRKIVVFVIIFLTIFGILYYKNFLFGNNISKNRSDKKIEQMLNSMGNYCAETSVTFSSNKTQNEYVIYQEVNGDYSMQEVKKGENIEGVKIEQTGNNLKISNSKMNLEKVYENCDNFLNNAMFLNCFAEEYMNEENQSSYSEENGEIILEITLNSNQNTYIKYKKLYVDAKTIKQTKLEIKDNTKKETICINYNSVELKSVQ